MPPQLNGCVSKDYLDDRRTTHQTSVPPPLQYPLLPRVLRSCFSHFRTWSQDRPVYRSSSFPSEPHLRGWEDENGGGDVHGGVAGVDADVVVNCWVGLVV